MGNSMAQQNTILRRAAVIALVGPEATGKSTLAYELQNWLAPLVNVRIVHVGKPPATWLTYPMHLILPLLKVLLPGCRTSRMKGYAPSAPPAATLCSEMAPQMEKIRWSTLINAWWSLCVAWERRQLLKQSHKAALNNTFIICDRYASNRPGLLDSARLTVNTEAKGWLISIYNRLARLEHNIYRQIPPPDVVLQLSVSFETAILRNRERIKAAKEGDEYMRNRRRDAQDWNRMGNERVFHIDTDAGLDITREKAIQVLEKVLYGRG